MWLDLRVCDGTFTSNTVSPLIFRTMFTAYINAFFEQAYYIIGLCRLQLLPYNNTEFHLYWRNSHIIVDN